MDIENVFTSLRKDEPRKDAVDSSAAGRAPTPEGIQKKETGKLSPNDNTPVDLKIDIEEIRKVLAGAAHGTDTAESDASQTSEIQHNLRNHLSNLSLHLFEDYHRLVTRLYHEAKVNIEKILPILEKREKKALELRNRILQCDRILARTGWSGMLFVVHKWMAKKEKPGFMIDLDRLEPDIHDDRKRIEVLEGIRDRLQKKVDLWGTYTRQTELYALSSEQVGELLKELKAGDDADIPKVDHLAFLRKQAELMEAMEKIVTFMELRANGEIQQFTPVVSNTAANKEIEKPVTTDDGHSAPDEKKECKDGAIPIETPPPAENIRVVKPDYSKVAACLAAQEAPAPEQKAVSATDRTVVDMISPLHANSLYPGNGKTPESKDKT